MSKPRAAILGSGPSGLLAAEACTRAGFKITIFTLDRNTPSPMGGSQYIHEEIPGITPESPDGEVIFHKVGTAYGYAAKVYGDEYAPTSWNIFPTGALPCWNLGSVYRRLHRYWREDMQSVKITPRWLDYLISRRDIFSLVISSIPAPILCTNPAKHKFPYVEVAFEPHQHQDKNLGANYIYYSGHPGDDWYRSSYIFGRGWWEYGMGCFPPDRAAAFIGKKPLDTDCDCRPRIIRVGRFGEWKKGRLVHHAYNKTIDALEVIGALQ